MTWVAVGAAVVGAGASIYSANKTAKATKDAAQATEVNPVNGISPYGSTLFDPASNMFAVQPNDSPFGSLLEQLGLSGYANAGAANSLPFMGANPELLQALQSANESSQPGSAEFMDVLGKLRAVSAPEEQRQNVALDNQQFANGTMGTTGGAERFRALKEAQAQADLQRQLSAQGITTQNANQRFANALTSVNQGMSNQLQQFNIGNGANSANMNAFQLLLQQLNSGTAAGGGMPVGGAQMLASSAGAMPQAVAQIANSDAFSAALQNIFRGSQPQTQAVGYAPPPNTNTAPGTIGPVM